ncbi:P-II family nitrogen regulator [Nitrosopumilus sp. K4]|uniref:P-II family nitrogen regulator n=1 Tax=Nitrosopumilus sp. K4 TaxID=2795383 RepID=UPI001BA667D6|nr:P-II family nitrogen regulator [Nitrosopumilus sp. K4]QUC64569.1 P-II family nitrogen regulator [Nitrosopumilus sp. K4]
MKKIEAIIKRSNYPNIANQLASMGYSIIDKRNLEDSKIFDKQSASKVGSSGLKTIPLSKIELVVSDKDARQVINLISKKSGFANVQGGKIFISEMEEVVDMETLEVQHDVETDDFKLPPKPKIKRSRLVPLQKFTLIKLEKIYDENEEKLQTEYRIKSFSDFVNHCIMGYLPTIEKQLKHETIVYGNNFGEF